MKRLKYDIEYISAISKEYSRSIGYVFVDNTDLVSGKLKPSNNDIDNIYDSMQKVINT